MTECEWTRKICDYLQHKCGCVVKVEYAGSRYVASGWPDRFICHAVWMGWLEFKGEKTIVTDLQRERMRELWVRQPGSVYVVRNKVATNLLQLYDGTELGRWTTPEELLVLLRWITAIAQRDYKALENAVVANNALQARINK